MAQATNNKSLRYAGIQSRRFAAGSRLPRLQHRRTNLCCFLLLLIGVPIPREHLVRDQCLAAEGAIGTTASLRNRPLHQQWHDGPGWVGITGSKNEEAVVRCHQRLKDRLPAYCRPRSPFRPMAGLAEAETVSINAQPAGSGSESRHLACEHHQTVVGRVCEFAG